MERGKRRTYADVARGMERLSGREFSIEDVGRTGSRSWELIIW